jgi:CBS domain-containing protein
MNISQIMTTEVVTVSPDTPLKDVAALLVRHRIAGLPVCEPDGTVVGVVSEGDILWKETGLRVGANGMIARILNVADGDDKRIGAMTAGEAMTAPAATIEPGATVAQAAKLMIDRQINRLPVVHEGTLVGIVARSDLVRAFLRSDEAIEHEIAEDVLLRMLWIDPDTVSISVENGNVTLTGTVENRSAAELTETYVRRIPGVVTVNSELGWAVDDLARRTAVAAAQLPPRT